MQSIIVIGLLVVIGLFSGIEYTRNSPEEINAFNSFKADQVAGNIMQYNDFLVKYMLDHYDDLHEIISNNPGNVEKINTIDDVANLIAMYNQKSFLMFLNYQSIIFNYADLSIESEVLPTLYLATTWDSFLPKIKNFNLTKMPEVMGATNQLVSEHLYQGNSTYWTIPILLSQSNCNTLEVYSQIPTDSSGNSQLIKVKNLFNRLCSQIEVNSAFKFLNYVFLEPVFIKEST